VREFTLPSLGAEMDSGKLIEWLIKPGEAVQKGQVVAIVETTKAEIDVEIWFDGVVGELLTVPGETVPVGAVMAKILTPDEAPPARTEGVRQRVSPAARRRAAELGLDLGAIVGTGEQGAVTLADLDAAAAGRPVPQATAAAASAPRPAPAAGTPDDRYASMRQAIAAAMSRSKREIPHYYLAQTISMARAVDWLTAQNAARPITERVLMAAVQLKAVARGLAEVPELNGFFIDGAFRPAPVAQIGLAISLRQGGLIAPTLHDVAAKPLVTVMAELSDLVSRARAGSLRSSEIADATITVTNLGDQGVDSLFGVIIPPQVAIVGFGRLAVRPWVTEAGNVAAVPTVTASLSADHRVSDGHTGARFLNALGDWLQRPEDL